MPGFCPVTDRYICHCPVALNAVQETLDAGALESEFDMEMSTLKRVHWRSC